jgi:hypothetical protein
MTAEQFTYWLQGFMEVANPTTLDATQTQIIKDHLALVFDKQTPNRDPGLFGPTIPVPPKQWPANPLAPMPTIPYPNQIEPDWWGGKNRVICETSPYTDNGENPLNWKFCNPTETYTSHGVPPHLFGKKEEDTVGTDSMKVIKEKKRKFRGGVKC